MASPMSFLRDNLTGAVRRVSVSSAGTQGNAASNPDLLDISADGLVVMFGSDASNLVAGDTNGVTDGFVYERTPPSCPVSLTVSPPAPLCTSTLVATAGGSADSEPTPPTYQYEWSKLEGETALSSRSTKAPAWGTWGHGSTDGVLAGIALLRGEAWRVRARATDGADDSAWTEPVVATIGNSRPLVPTQLTISPAAPVCNTPLSAAASGASDADTGDTVSYQYQWALVAAASGTAKPAVRSKDLGWGHDSTDGTLSGVALRRGEIWAVHARATDGTLDSAWTDPLQTTIQNALPAVTQVTVMPLHPRTTADLTATPSASDPDSDPLTCEVQWQHWAAGDGWSGWTETGAVLDASKTTPGERWQAPGASL